VGVKYPGVQEEKFEEPATIEKGGVNYYMESTRNLVLIHRISSVIHR
jgi:hypothetical protein